MSRYSSDSSDDDYRGKSSRRKRYRSGSSSSTDSYIKGSKRRTRKSRSHSRDRSKHSYRDKRNSNKDTGRSHRSRSRRRYRSTSRSRSRSRNSLSSYKKKSYSKSKRRYRTRSRSRSQHRKSRSHSRRRSKSKQKSYYRSRSRSSSSSRKRNSPSNKNGNESSSSEDSAVMERKQFQFKKSFDAKSIIKIDSFPENNYSTVIIPSDDPITKQEQLDDINAPSFTQKAFKSRKTGRNEEHSVKSNFNNFESKIKIESDSYINNLEIGTSKFVEDGDQANEKRKNDTVFHDDIAFEDNELKVQKWVKKLLAIRQKLLFGCPN